jgi:hypothetical protein
MAIKEEVKTVRLSDRVTVRGTGKGKFLQEGKLYEVHPLQAERLKKKGAAEDVKN